MEAQIMPGFEEAFVFGGNAVFTLKSLKTGKHYTYKVIQKGRNFFASVLSSSDNTNDYTYLGILKRDGLYLTKASPFDKSAKCIKALDYFMLHMTNMPQQLEVYHEGRCCYCGRRLTTPESIQLGYGPKCARI